MISLFARDIATLERSAEFTMAGLIERYTKWLHTQWPAGTVEKLPVSGPEGTTAQPGVRIVGDLTGIPLLKFSSDTGARAVRAIVAKPESRNGRLESGMLDLAIIGAGVAGISAAIEAKRAGLKFAIYEATEIFSTVVNFPKAKPIYTYPTEMKLDGGLQFTADIKEALLSEMEEQRRAAGIEVTVGRVEGIETRGGLVSLHLSDQTVVTARHAIIAIGRSGNFRKLGVPGEELDKVYNRLFDPKEFAGQNSLVVGGGDSALETAIALASCGSHVTLSYRGKELSRAKPANIEKVEMLVRDASADVQIEKPTSERVNTAVTSGMRGQKSPGSLKVALGTQVTRIEPDRVFLQPVAAGVSSARDSSAADTAAPTGELPNDVVFTMLGREAPLAFFRRSGIPIAGEGTGRGWIALGFFLAFCIFVYAWKSGGFAETWLNPWPENMPAILSSLGGWFQAQIPDRSTLLGTLAVSLKSRSFYYTLLYSSLIVGFGITRIRRRRTPYVTWQTIVLMLVQVVPLFVLPEIILPYFGYNGWFDQGLGKTIADRLFESYIPEAQQAAHQWPEWGHPRAYWRAYGFILAWPLMVYNVFTDAPLTWWLVIAFVQTFVLIPALIWRWGKGAYCGWICSCGALAETMGDQQRHKMPHGPFWNRLNMAGQVILAIAILLLIIRVLGWIWPQSIFASAFHLLLEGKNGSGRLVTYLNYKWLVDVFLGGVIGVGLYFKYSGRVWCRFFCPLAALMHIYARFSRFRIFPEKSKCISCNVCTSVCHQGIDIMNFANKGLPMQDPECVRCSACVQQCPTGVLAFGRYDGERRIVLDKLPASPVRMREGH